MQILWCCIWHYRSEYSASVKRLKDYYKQVFKSFDEVQPYAKTAGVKIAVENLLFAPAEDQRDQFERLFERYDREFIGLCFDSGHASIMFQDNYYELLEKYYDRLYATFTGYGFHTEGRSG